MRSLGSSVVIRLSEDLFLLDLRSQPSPLRRRSRLLVRLRRLDVAAGSRWRGLASRQAEEGLSSQTRSWAMGRAALVLHDSQFFTNRDESYRLGCMGMVNCKSKIGLAFN